MPLIVQFIGKYLSVKYCSMYFQILFYSAKPKNRFKVQKSNSMSFNCKRFGIILNAYTPMFIAALFTIARTWKQPRYPSADEWIRECGTYTQWNITQLLKRMHFNQF